MLTTNDNKTDNSTSIVNQQINHRLDSYTPAQLLHLIQVWAPTPVRLLRLTRNRRRPEHQLVIPVSNQPATLSRRTIHSQLASNKNLVTAMELVHNLQATIRELDMASQLHTSNSLAIRNLQAILSRLLVIRSSQLDTLSSLVILSSLQQLATVSHQLQVLDIQT